MDPHDFELDIALALREVRLYWRPGRDPLSLDDKRRLARIIIDHLGRARITIVRAEPPPQGRGTGHFLR
jgi:hypothetical protein